MRSTARPHFRFLTTISAIVLIATLDTVATMTPVSALNLATPASVRSKAGDQMFGDVIEVRAVVHRGGAAVGARGGAYHSRTAVVGPRGNVAVHNRTAVVRGGGWARPANYRWPRGGAIAAGAAIGFVTAATAAAWAGAAPAPGMCWYYTDPSRTQGFWDYCQ